MDQEVIKALEEKGFNRWQKGAFDRLYVNASQLGLVCEYHKTGNIKNSWFRGEMISNRQAGKMRASKTFVDVTTGQVYSDNDTLKGVVVDLLEKVNGEVRS